MKTSGFKIGDFSPKVQAQIRAQIARDGDAYVEVKGGAARVLEAVPAPWPVSLWLAYHVPSLNRLLFRSPWQLREIKAAATAPLVEALAALPARPAQGRERVHVVVTCFVLKVRDADNPCPKFLIDALRAARVLRDDDPGSMALTVNPDVRVRRRAECGTRVTIAEALP